MPNPRIPGFGISGARKQSQGSDTTQFTGLGLGPGPDTQRRYRLRLRPNHEADERPRRGRRSWAEYRLHRAAEMRERVR